MQRGPSRRERRSSRSDHELLAASADGDETAFAELVHRHRGLITTACASGCIDPGTREDAFQQAVLDIWKGCGLFRGDAKPSTWLYTVARNAAIKVGRRESREAAVSTAELPDVPFIGHERDGLTGLKTALMQLPPDHRDAVLLQAEGYSLQQIADIKIVAVGTVKSWIHRGRQDLLRSLGGPP